MATPQNPPNRTFPECAWRASILPVDTSELKAAAEVVEAEVERCKGTPFPNRISGSKKACDSFHLFSPPRKPPVPIEFLTSVSSGLTAPTPRKPLPCGNPKRVRKRGVEDSNLSITQFAGECVRWDEVMKHVTSSFSIRTYMNDEHHNSYVLW